MSDIIVTGFNNTTQFSGADSGTDIFVLCSVVGGTGVVSSGAFTSVTIARSGRVSGVGGIGVSLTS